MPLDTTTRGLERESIALHPFAITSCVCGLTPSFVAAGIVFLTLASIRFVESDVFFILAAMSGNAAIFELLAVVVCALLVIDCGVPLPMIAIGFGIEALREISQSPSKGWGRGLAVLGIVMGGLCFAAAVLILVFLLLMAVSPFVYWNPFRGP